MNVHGLDDHLDWTDDEDDPIDRLTAAIDKLTKLAIESTPGPWHCETVEQEVTPGYPKVWTSAENVYLAATVAMPDDFTQPRGVNARADMEAIVTLHRTLDPLLAWLTDQAARLRADVEATSPKSQELHYRHALAVADAILGGEQ